MNKCMIAATLGFLVGMYIGYSKEDEINDICRQSKRTKKKMKRQYHKAMNHLMDCMD